MVESPLQKLGFPSKQIIEVIVSTYGDGDFPTAAPMGVMSENDKLVLRPYTATQTYRNLREHKCCVVNLTTDPDLFYRTALKEVNKDGKVPLEWFGKASTVEAPMLKKADVSIEASVVSQMNESIGRAKFICEVLKIEVANHMPQPYCRATFALLESIIHATRVKEFLPREIKESDSLIASISNYKQLIEKVAPNSNYARIIDDLYSRVTSWRSES
ncbi:MAG: DUF447 domain-containing protein [Candidatus Bathyarchaeota archaeon]